MAVRRSTVALLTGASGVGAFALTLALLDAFQRETPATAVQAEAGMHDVRPAELDSVITASDVQDTSVAAQAAEQSAETSPQQSISATLEPPFEDVQTQYLKGLLGDDHYREYINRNPRPFFWGCKPDIETPCPFGRPLLTEQEDPTWSDDTEKLLRAVWDENVPDLSDEFLFVMCKAIACQVNYRFPLDVTKSSDLNKPHIHAFMRGFQGSNLTSKLRWIRVSYAGPIMAVDFERIRSQDDR